MNILLVDDSKTMRTIQKKILEVHPGVQFFEAADGLEALKIIPTISRVDLALVDWNMPNMDGHTLVTKIRETDKKMPIIMCTTEAEKPRVIDALKAGVNNYVVKPFTPEVLLEKVEATLKKLRQAA
jgi:two-component system chemotaxis response regulator CheY